MLLYRHFHKQQSRLFCYNIPGFFLYCQNCLTPPPPPKKKSAANIAIKATAFLFFLIFLLCILQVVAVPNLASERGGGGTNTCTANKGQVRIQYKFAHRHMNLEIGTEAAQFPEKKFINGIFIAVYDSKIVFLVHESYFTQTLINYVSRVCPTQVVWLDLVGTCLLSHN
jgi:hypothetical protein